MKLLNKLRITIISIATASTIVGALRSNFLFGFGVGFVVSSLMIATIARKYG